MYEKKSILKHATMMPIQVTMFSNTYQNTTVVMLIPLQLVIKDGAYRFPFENCD